jgi:cell division septation protein DedD
MVGGYMMGDGTVFVTEPPPPPPAQFAVLVGSFRLDQNANVASEQVVSMGFNTYRKTQYINGVPFVRIYAGPFIDQNSANNAFNHLKAYLNFSGSIVPFEPS